MNTTATRTMPTDWSKPTGSYSNPLVWFFALHAFEKIIYLQLLFTTIAYVFSIGLLGLLPSMIVSLSVHGTLTSMKRNGVQASSRLGVFIIFCIEAAQSPLHQTAYSIAISALGIQLPLGATVSQGGWYLAVLLFVLTFYAILSVVANASRAAEEAEHAANLERADRLDRERREAEAAEAKRRADAEAENRKLEIAKLEVERKRVEAEAEAKRKSSEIEAEKLKTEQQRIEQQKQIELTRQRAETERIKAEGEEKRKAEAEADARKQTAADAEARRKRAEMLAEIEAEAARKQAEFDLEQKRKQAEAKRKREQEVENARRRQSETAMPSASGSSEAFRQEYERAKAALFGRGITHPTQAQIGLEMTWRGVQGVSDKTIRNHLNPK